MEFNTALLHQNYDGDPSTGATVTPIYQTSAFAYDSAEQLEKVFNNRAPGFSYTRIGNPTVDAFEKRMAGLERGIGAVACSSGMAAVTLSLLNILQSGDEIIAGAGLFGGTLDLFADLEKFGITTHIVPHVTASSVEPLLNDHTKAVFGELIGNPGLDIIDIAEVAKVVHAHGIPLLIDSTTATPALVRPGDFGADIVIHSTSKYINGGGNAISGIIVDTGKFPWCDGKFPNLEPYRPYGPFAYLAKLRNDTWRNMGSCLSPMNAFVNSIGLETLGLRMERLCDNAYILAEFLASQDGVTVNYPGLKDNPYYDLTQEELGGKAGAIITIRVGSKERAFDLINHLQYATIATNIGDVRTLVIHPASTIYTHNTKAQREAAGVYEDSIRISVGIEDAEDLVEDFCQALQSIS